MASIKRDDRLTVSQCLVCGAVAGVFSRTVTSPLDVVKVLGQVGTFHTRNGFWNTFRQVYRSEGIAAYWKGNLIACMRLFPYSVVQLASYKRILHLYMDDRGYITQWGAIVAGSLAGIVATLITYPADVIETRLIIQNKKSPSYKGIMDALRTICKNEGFLTLYRGASLTLIGAIPFSCGAFLVYMNLDKLWGEPSFKFGPFQNFISGCLAAGFAQTLSFPFDTIKRKMQAQSPILPHCGGVNVHFSGMVDCFRQVIKIKGIHCLWDGLTANLLKIVPYYGLMFSTFEFCKRVCLYKNGFIVSPLSYQLAPGVDQSLRPQELRELRKYFHNRNFKSEQSSLKSRW
ncbi:solute carrier family 25 member 43 [Polypterus senegalus]